MSAWLPVEAALLPPWSRAIAILAGGAVLLLLLGALFRRRSLGRGAVVQLVVLVLSLAAAACLAGAGANPLLVEERVPDRLHLAVVIDVSDSVQRAAGGWQQPRDMALAVSRTTAMALPPEVQQAATASLITFKSTASLFTSASLRELPAALQRLEPGDFASGPGTNLAAGLALAGKQIDKAGGRGAILLVSDGHQTEGNALTAARALARRGIPVTVAPIEGGAPELAIVAADLPREVRAESPTFLRGVLSNAGATPADTVVSVGQNTGLEGPRGRAGSATFFEAPLAVPAGERRMLRQPLVFEGVGLQFADVTLGQPGAPTHRRRLFTYVDRPLRVLAAGSTAGWIEALPGDVAEVETIEPASLDPQFSFADYDVVVISDVDSTAFPPGALAGLARAVQQDGTGLMMLNGAHAGRDREAPTVLMSYANGPLDPLLPVSPIPRPENQEPPPLRVVLMIDNSGSMAGGGLDQAKMISTYIIENLLRHDDALDVIVFSDSATHPVRNRRMDANGVRDAAHAIENIGVGGGTNPQPALELLASLEMGECGLIFISDGEFSPVSARPECKTVAFSIGAGAPTAELAALAQQVETVHSGYNPAGLKLVFVEPEQRDTFWEPGEYTAHQANRLARGRGRLPVPELPLEGNAVNYVRPGATLVAVRPRLTDPVLAYGRAGAGEVGVLTTAIPPGWGASPEGREAVSAWITRVAGFTARGRYDIQVIDRGASLALRIMVGDGESVPSLSGLEARIERAGGLSDTLYFRAEPTTPATFLSEVVIPREATAQRAILVLMEGGPDALERPQRLPLVIPPAGEVARELSREAFTYGLNEEVLLAVAGAGGGRVLAPDETPSLLASSASPPAGRPFWHWLVVAGMLAYVGAIGVRRFFV